MHSPVWSPLNLNLMVSLHPSLLLSNITDLLINGVLSLLLSSVHRPVAQQYLNPGKRSETIFSVINIAKVFLSVL